MYYVFIIIYYICVHEKRKSENINTRSKFKGMGINRYSLNINLLCYKLLQITNFFKWNY